MQAPYGRESHAGNRGIRRAAGGPRDRGHGVQASTFPPVPSIVVEKHAPSGANRDDSARREGACER